MRQPFLLALLIATTSLVNLSDEPHIVKVDVTIQGDYVALAPTGTPPTFSALAISRVVDPETRRPYDRSNESLGCDPSQLRRTFRLEASNVLLGEPILIEFRVELNGPGRWDENVGGNYRGLGRDGNFFFLMRHADGSWVPDIFEGHAMTSYGGLGGSCTVKHGEPYSDWLAVQQWCAIDRTGIYDLYAFHWGGSVHTVGLRQRVEAALTDEMNKRVRVDEDGQLIDRETMERPGSFFVEHLWNVRDEPNASPVAASIPTPVKAKLKGTANASDYAHFTLTVRQGADREREAMVRHWTKPVMASGSGMLQAERLSAAVSAMALARQDDFLPALKRHLQNGEKSELDVLFIGLAMRDDVRAIDLLFEVGGSKGIEAMRFLRPSRVGAAIPKLINLLISQNHLTRAAAEEILQRWCGQEFGHTWEGYNHKRPTLAEGRAMQPLYRSWWERNKDTFQPRFH
jgi:hypothetical protein